MIKTGYNLFPVLLLLLILSGPTDLSAQTAGKLAGRVTDESGQALIGATIIVEGTNKGAVTDYDGMPYEPPRRTATPMWTHMGLRMFSRWP